MTDSWDPIDCSLPGSSVHGISQQAYWSGLPFPSQVMEIWRGGEPRSAPFLRVRLCLRTSAVSRWQLQEDHPFESNSPNPIQQKTNWTKTSFYNLISGACMSRVLNFLIRGCFSGWWANLRVTHAPSKTLFPFILLCEVWVSTHWNYRWWFIQVLEKGIITIQICFRHLTLDDNFQTTNF